MSEDILKVRTVVAQNLLIQSSDGVMRASLIAMEDGQAGLALFDMEGRQRAGFMMGPDGNPFLALVDKNGTFRVELTFKGDEPRISLLDRNGTVRVVAMILEGKIPLAQLQDSTGEPVKQVVIPED